MEKIRKKRLSVTNTPIVALIATIPVPMMVSLEGIAGLLLPAVCFFLAWLLLEVASQEANSDRYWFAFMGCALPTSIGTLVWFATTNGLG